MIHRRSVDNPAVPVDSPNRRYRTSDFLSGLAVVLSALAFLVSGFNAYQIAGLRGELALRDANSNGSSSTNNGAVPFQSAPQPLTNQSNTAPPRTTLQQSSLSVAPVQPTTAASDIQPGQFRQLAYDNQAQIELLSASRVRNPQTGAQDVVEVQLRVSRVGDRIDASQSINLNNTIARSPNANATYPVVNSDRSTGSVPLYNLRQGAATEAFVQLGVPEGVNTIDILIPESGTFRNVPIQ